MITNSQFYCDVCNKTYARLFVLEKHQSTPKHLRNLAEKQQQEHKDSTEESSNDDPIHNIYKVVQKQQKEIKSLHEKLDKVLLILNKVDQILPYIELVE
jgi:hypothetical protein